MTRRALLLLTLAACGNGSSKDVPAGATAGHLAVTAKIDGPYVVVTATCTEYATLEALGASTTCHEGPTELRILATKLGAGPHTFAAEANHGDERMKGEVAITIPAAAVAPFLVIEDCVSEYSGNDGRVGVFVKTGGKNFNCDSFHGARVKLEIKASPNAKLTFGGKPITIAETGEAAPIVDLSEGILALTVDQLAVDSMSASTPIEVPWTLEVGNSKLAGKITVQESVGYAGKLSGQWLADIAAGKIDRPAFTVAKPGERRTIALFGDDGKLSLTDRRGTVRDLDLIAVAKEIGRTESGTCDFESSGKVVRARRFSVEVEVKITNLADGSVVATKKFLPSPDGCPMFVTFDPSDPRTAVSPDSDKIMKWLETFALPTA